MKTLPNYLKVFRKQSGLSQKDLAYILGKPSVCSISKLENSQTSPDLKTIISLSLLYEANLDKLFPKIYATCRNSILENMGILSGKYEKSDNIRDKFKVAFLEKTMGGIVISA